MTATAPSRSVGQAAIQKYRPVIELGRGGMATVHLCVLQGLGGFTKLQVVKRLRSELADEPEFRAMFIEEARVAARINHPNVVQTNEVGIDDRNIFIAMEYVEGQSLEHFIRAAAKAGNPLDLSMLLPIVVEALRGLSFAHELKDFQGKPLRLVHRDVSPHNILVTYGGHVKVVDFGIAKASDSAHETRTGVLKGKVAYVAPEQINARKMVDCRVDVFAVGAILWRALTGKRLWRGMSEVEILMKVSKGAIPSPATVNPGLDPAIVAICMKALAPDATARYQSANELIAALEGYLPKLGRVATNKEIGERLSGLFDAHRKKVAAAIEARISDPRSGSWEDVDAEEAARNTSTPSYLSASSTLDKPAAAEAAAATLPAPAPATRRKRRWIGAVLGALALLGAAGAVIAVRERSAKRAKAVAHKETTESVGSIAPKVAPAPASLELRVAVTPASATVYVDSEALKSSYPMDGEVHRIRVESTGYRPEVQLVSFDRPVVALTFALTKASTPTAGHRVGTRAVVTATLAATRSRPPPTASPPPPPPATTTRTTPAAPASTGSRLTIDNSNPW